MYFLTVMFNKTGLQLYFSGCTVYQDTSFAFGFVCIKCLPAVSKYQKKAFVKWWWGYLVHDDMHHQIFDFCTRQEIKMISYSDKKPH